MLSVQDATLPPQEPTEGGIAQRVEGDECGGDSDGEEHDPDEHADNEVVRERMSRLEIVELLEVAALVARLVGLAHSHSMVPGGLEVTSSTTRLTSRTSFVMRVEILASTS